MVAVGVIQLVQAKLTFLSATSLLDTVLHLEALHFYSMAEAPASTPSEEGLPVQWNHANRRSRKSGCSNIFTGVNLHQLHRLFRTAGDRDAEHRAKLVWRGMDADMEGAEEEKEEDRGFTEEAGLAQALVGLRVRARNKAGFRAEGHKDHKWFRAASGYLRIEEPLSDYTVEHDEADIAPSPGEYLLATEEDLPETQNPFKPSTWRLDVARQESAGHSERYLHRILH